MNENLENQEWLKAQYASKSMQEIADDLGVSRNTVRNRMVKFGIERRDKREMLSAIGKRPKSDEQKLKMSESAKKRWRRKPMTDAMREKISVSRRLNGRESSPYNWVFDVKHGYIAEHRLIMIKHLGRTLERNEHVHHIDGNPQNNELGNLVVLTHSDHAKLHDNNRKRDDKGKFSS